MARQIVKESFYILCNRFAFFIPPAVISVVIMLASSLLPQNEVSVYRFLLNFSLCLFAEIPCFAMYYGKRPVISIRNRLPSLIPVIILYCLFSLLVSFVSGYISNVMGEDAGKLVFTVILWIVHIAVNLFICFILASIIKNDDGLKAATISSVNILFSNKVWNICLYVKILLLEFAVIFIAVLVLVILTGILYALIPISLGLVLIPVFISLFMVYSTIRTCHYYEAIS